MNNVPDTFKRDEEEMQIIPLLKLCINQLLRNWYWFLLSIVICLGLGWIYRQSQPSVFKQQSVILIEEADSDPRSRMVKGNMSGLLELNGISVGDNLKNEIFILSSKRLMTRVVDKLDLDVDYLMPVSLHKVALYKNERPIEVLFHDSLPSENPIPKNMIVSLKIKKLDQNTVEIKGFRNKKGKKTDEKIKANFGQTVKTPAGRLSVVRSKMFNKWEDEEITVNRNSVSATADALRMRMDVAQIEKEASLIGLTFQDINPKRAVDVLNTLYNTYKEDVVENKNRVALNTARFIDERLKLIGTELSDVENNLASFKKRNSVLDFETTAQSITQESSLARQKTLEAETQLNVAQYLYNYLDNQTNDRDLIPALSLKDASFNTTIDKYNQLQMQRNQMANNSSDDHAVVRELDKQLHQMRQSIKASVANYISTCKLQLDDAKAAENMLTGRLAGAPEQEKLGIDIVRQQKLKETLYTYLLNKREEVAMKQAINEANVRLVEGPMGSDIPISPRTMVILLISLVIGVMIPAFIIWLRIAMDVSVRGRKDIEDNTTIPLLGEIPNIKDSDGKTLITDLPSDDPIVEGFRIMRYNLGYMRHNTQVMICTSTTPGQGKSFISRNVASILAMTGKKVLLIDADIRKGTLSRNFGQAFGLTTFLSDEHTQIDEIIQKDHLTKGVDFIPAGNIPPNPSELLMSKRFEEMITALRERYDHIIIDSTPLFSVADASITSRVADITLFVIRAQVQDRNFLPELERMYQDNRFKHLSIVLNDVNMKSDGTYGQGYGYGYGYGYGSHTKQKRSLNVLRRLRR